MLKLTVASLKTKIKKIMKSSFLYYLTIHIMQDIKLAVHAHPTLSEVLDELFKAAKVNV